MLSKIWIPSTSPTGLPRAPRPLRVLDTRRDRNREQPCLEQGPALPDDKLIACLVSLGAPRWFAEELRHSPQLRFKAAQVYFLVEDAAAGRHVTHPVTGEKIKASELVDSMRAEYEASRKIELISDRPGHTIGLFER
jgi:hypothetical protein